MSLNRGDRNGRAWKISQVLDYLYITDWYTAKNKKALDKAGITHIINISDHKNCFPNDYEYLRIQQIDAGRDIEKHFDTAHDFIMQVKKTGGKVLVHCSQGVSRSATLVSAHLIKQKGWDAERTVDFLRQRHSKANPNPEFHCALRRLARGTETNDDMPPRKRTKTR